MAQPRFDWYFKEWLAATGKRQADIVRDLDWNKAKVSLMVNGKQAYTREEVNELAEYLHVHPHELLMHPEDAFAVRRLKIVMRDFAGVPYGGTVGDEDTEPLKKVS